MSENLLNVFQWYGAIAGTIAAFVVSLDLGRRPTGWAFVLFVTASIAYVAWGFLNDEGKAVAWQNVVLFAINIIGVYRYLIRKKPVHAE
jgi:nicotinamide riboside transporter PnuC